MFADGKGLPALRKVLVFIVILAGIFVLTSVNITGDLDAPNVIHTLTGLKDTVIGIFDGNMPAETAEQTGETGHDPAPAATPAPDEPTPTPTPAPTPEPTPVVLPYTMAWLDEYAPASVASFEEQVGDNGDYEEVTTWPPPDTYKLIVDYHNQCVYALSKDEYGKYKVLERVMICTTGGNGNWTPEGTYHLGSSRVRFGYFTDYNCYAQYWSQMMGSFYFHSVLYSARDAESYSMSSYDNLGKAVSHGCIRLLVPDARWIYENCAPGTLCIVTTEYPVNEKLKNALKNGYEGAVDYESAEEDEGQG
jgi:lipoprotein-anchoring transpeptidase ErfK/SrfK